MTNRHKKHRHHHISKSRDILREQQHAPRNLSAPKLEIVLKCDSAGSLEAVRESIRSMETSGVDVVIIKSGVGDVHKSDIDMASTGSKLIIGYQVNLQKGTGDYLRQSGVSVRMYDIIYNVTNDLSSIVDSMKPRDQEEDITGSAKVIAIFKSGRKDIIAGCRVETGSISLHQRYRIISAMGPVYANTIDSMHIDDHAVHKAVKGQNVGIKIRNFKKVHVGDFLETFRLHSDKKPSL